ncbi:MAG: DinB family protein [Dongiaceae bacterium]
MISIDHVRVLARYNKWMNEKIYATAAQLSDEERKRDRGAFFKSIHATLNHILWGDQIWMHRLAGTPKPAAGSIGESVAQFGDFTGMTRERQGFDQVILGWAAALDAAALAEDFSYYSAASGRQIVKPRWLLVTHMFNHQTHHRGQVHCLLTQCGLKPGDTDLPFMDG